ncbi:MAG: inositol monophosphatase family protein [Nitrososphaerales archaeon]
MLTAPKGEEWIEILRKAAKAGERSISENYNIESRTKVVKKGFGGDMTLEIDEASEKAIHDSLDSDLGADSYIFVSEEIGEIPSKSAKPIVLCDPLDGSHNAQVGIPLFSISLSVIGLARRILPNEARHFGDVDIGLIRNICSGDEYYAIKGAGAFHNLARINRPNSKGGRFETLGIECGDVDLLKDILSKLSSKQVYKVRVLGSAAISYCLLADGTFRGFIFAQPGGARTIDSPAGYLIARETGCVFQDLSGKARSIDSVDVGFESRINLAGAVDDSSLSKLTQLVGTF